MADNEHTTGQIIQLADYLRKPDPTVSARLAMNDSGENDFRYERAKDAFLASRPKTLSGAQAQLQYALDLMTKAVREGDELTQDGWNDALALLGNVDSLLSEFTRRQAS